MFVTEVPKNDLEIDLFELGYYFAIEKIAQEVGTVSF